MSKEGKRGGPYVKVIVFETPFSLIDGVAEVQWKLFAKTAFLPQVNNWPSLVLSRTADWGWRMENCWVVYASTEADIVDRLGGESMELAQKVLALRASGSLKTDNRSNSGRSTAALA